MGGRLAALSAGVAVLALAGCGGDGDASGGKPALAWDGDPVVRASQSTTARVLIGKVKQQAVGGPKAKIEVADLRVVDQDGKRIEASVAFVSTFVRSLYPQSGRPGASRDEFPEKEQRRIGYIAVLRSGETSPLTVSWKEPPGPRRAVAIDFGAGRLPIPRTTTR